MNTSPELAKEKNYQVETVLEAKKENRRFISSVFTFGQIIGILLAWMYWVMCPDNDQRLFHVIVFYAAAGITIPMFVCTMRLMLKGYYLSLMGWQSTSRMIEGYEKLQHKAEPIAEKVNDIVDSKIPPLIEKIDQVVDKAVPIAVNVEDIVHKAKVMSEDVEKIAHRIRDMVDSVNGNFDLGNIEKKIEKLSESLSAIASAFTPFEKRERKPGDIIPTFDPLQAGRRKG